MTEGITYLQSVTVDATAGTRYSMLRSSPFHHNQLFLTVIQICSVQSNELFYLCKFFQSFVPIAFIAYDPGLGLIFQLYFSGICGMAWRLYLHKEPQEEALVGDFVSLLSVLFSSLWSEIG